MNRIGGATIWCARLPISAGGISSTQIQ